MPPAPTRVHPKFRKQLHSLGTLTKARASIPPFGLQELLIHQHNLYERGIDVNIVVLYGIFKFSKFQNCHFSKCKKYEQN